MLQGLPFTNEAGWMIQALEKMISFRLSFSQNLLVLHHLALLLWIGIEFHQRDLLSCTYCMHIHKFHECIRRIMDDVTWEYTCCDNDVKLHNDNNANSLFTEQVHISSLSTSNILHKRISKLHIAVTSLNHNCSSTYPNTMILDFLESL